jgi:hypothetical protein
MVGKRTTAARSKRVQPREGGERVNNPLDAWEALAMRDSAPLARYFQEDVPTILDAIVALVAQGHFGATVPKIERGTSGDDDEQAAAILGEGWMADTSLLLERLHAGRIHLGTEFLTSLGRLIQRLGLLHSKNGDADGYRLQFVRSKPGRPTDRVATGLEATRVANRIRFRGKKSVELAVADEVLRTGMGTATVYRRLAMTNNNPKAKKTKPKNPGRK